MNLHDCIFSNRRWKPAMLILPFLLCHCQNNRSTIETVFNEEPETYRCDPDFFKFTIDEKAIFESTPNDSVPLKWEYYNDVRYDYDNFDMDCECPEFILDEDDIHYFSFNLGQEKDLDISIRKYWVNWSGREFYPSGYDFDKTKLFESPRIKFQLKDKTTGCLYETGQGRFYIRRFKFGKCIKAEFNARLESKDCGSIALKGAFGANYTGLKRSKKSPH